MPMDIAKLVLEYCRVVASWPVAILVLTAIFMTKFKIPITAVIDRIASIRLPGGGELLTPQSGRNIADRNLRAVESTPETGLITGQPVQGAGAALASERERAYLWEYRYLNYFLVPRTQTVLGWLASRTGQLSYATYDSWLLPLVPDPVERSAIIEALAAHHLIRIENGMISVSEKGQEYLRWRGPLNVVIAAWNAAHSPSRPGLAPGSSSSPSLPPSPSPEPAVAPTVERGDAAQPG